MKFDETNQRFWTVQLLPLYPQDKENYTTVNRLQEEICIEQNLFGMGWSDEGKTETYLWRELFCKYTLKYKDKNPNKLISKEKAEQIINRAREIITEIKKIRKEKNIKEINTSNLEKLKIEEKDIDILNLYNELYSSIFGKNNALETSIDYYKQIKENDIVIARLRNGKYCIGRVCSNEIKIVSGDLAKKQDEILKDASSSGFSWYMQVHKWYQIDEVDIPGHISGRFSSRSSRRTIYPVNNEHMIQLMKIIYTKNEMEDESVENDRLSIVEKPIPISKENIAEVLSPYELEDLAFLFIMSKHEDEGYRLLPSKCKLDEVRYECYLINKDKPNKVIAFQTKNRKKLECSEYIDDRLTKIYLYSALGYDWNGQELSGNTYDKDDKKEEERIRKIKKTIQQNSNAKNIEIISNKDLFETFKKSNYFNKLLTKGYYKL